MWHNEPNKHYKKKQGYWLLRCNQVIIQAETEPGFVITINQQYFMHFYLQPNNEIENMIDQKSK